MIYRGPEPRVDIPNLDVTSFVLGQAELRGDKPALIDGPSGRALTYADLARRTRATAAGLARRGFDRGDVLGVYMPNIPEYALAFHGASAAGGACTTVSPLYTAHELAHQLEDAGAKLLMTVPSLCDVALEAKELIGLNEVVVVGGEEQGATPFHEFLGDPADAPEVELDPDVDLAALPYSSGTTGLPKGVMLTHRNLVANIVRIQEALPVDADDTLIGVLPFFHIYGMVVVMNQGLWAGATVVTMPRYEFGLFLDLLERHRITRAYVVPPIALSLGKEPNVGEHDLSALRIVASGGAPLGAEVSERVAKRLSCNVIQAYGLTETSSVTHIIRAEGEERPGSIGRPLPGTECRVVAPASGGDVEQGSPGELLIRGPQVMLGYLNNPEASGATVDHDGWLHTGDVAIADSDGYFEIVDRLKELIKYKGHQVAPAELEALIITHPHVSDVAVVGIPDEKVGELPKAFVVPAGDDLDADELIDWVGERIAPYKRIRQVELIGEIPRSPSGKILRRALMD